MVIIKLILYPLVPVYLLVITLRNWLFDRNIFKTTKVAAKVISVGNITIGGSGKTPLVIYLAEVCFNGGKDLFSAITPPYFHEDVFLVRGWDNVPVYNLIAQQKYFLFHR